MPKKRVDLLLEPELLEQVDQRAASLRWSRTTLVTAALENYLDDASRGVPDPPAPRTRTENLRETPAGEVVKADPAKPASFRLPPGVTRGVPRRDPSEPNVDHFGHTSDYRAAMTLWRAGKPFDHLKKEGK